MAGLGTSHNEVFTVPACSAFVLLSERKILNPASLIPPHTFSLSISCHGCGMPTDGGVSGINGLNVPIVSPHINIPPSTGLSRSILALSSE